MKHKRKNPLIFLTILIIYSTLMCCSGMDADTESLQVPFASEDDGKPELDTEKCVTESKEPKLKKTDRVPKNEASVIGKEKNHSEAESSVAIEETETEAGKNAEVVEPSDEFSDESITLTDIPVYSGNAYVEINDNVPFFTDAEMTTSSYEFYSELDSFGRCGVCMASIGIDLMPTEERGTIGDVKPSGWHTIKYTGIVDGNYLYNRCHLIAYELTGENANVKNLITGTRYMNINGMLPFENMTTDYVKETGNHVMYRVTPIFEGANLVASGVLMEAKSVEDNGEGLMFNVFCYNVQPGIVIDYATGDSETDGTFVASAEGGDEKSDYIGEYSETSQENSSQESATKGDMSATESVQQDEETTATGIYAVNANNGKIHIIGACPATKSGSNSMKNPVYFDTYEEALAYSERVAPSQSKRNCGSCW